MHGHSHLHSNMDDYRRDSGNFIGHTGTDLHSNMDDYRRGYFWRIRGAERIYIPIWTIIDSVLECNLQPLVWNLHSNMDDYRRREV